MLSHLRKNSINLPEALIDVLPALLGVLVCVFVSFFCMRKWFTSWVPACKGGPGCVLPWVLVCRVAYSFPVATIVITATSVAWNSTDSLFHSARNPESKIIFIKMLAGLLSPGGLPGSTCFLSLPALVTAGFPGCSFPCLIFTSPFLLCAFFFSVWTSSSFSFTIIHVTALRPT